LSAIFQKNPTLMPKFKIIRFHHPGVFSLKTNIWYKFDVNKEKFAFLIGNIKKGLTVHDPDNSIIQKQNFKIRKKINDVNPKNYCIKTVAYNRDIDFFSITEQDPFSGRNFYDKPYTEMFLLLDYAEEPITFEKVKYYLKHLFIRYNTNAFHSTVLVPEDTYWQESMIFLEGRFETQKNFDEFTTGAINFNLNFQPVAVYHGMSKYGPLPHKESFIQSNKNFKEIPDDYIDVFELYAVGVMQMNYYQNFKMALLEAFVAVEVLVVRITDEQKMARGVSKTKISEFKQAIDIAHKMDVELRLFFNFDKKEEILLGQMVRARKIRNKIMHQNEKVDKKEVIDIIKNINKFLFMLIEKDSA
jgi:hypothetical protein